MTTRTLIIFFAIAFGLTWGIAALLVLFPDGVTSLFGEIGYTNPLFVLAVYAPAFGALFLIWWHHGAAGIGGFLRRLLLWRLPGAWWILLVVVIPAVYYAGAALKGSLSEPFPFDPRTAVIPALVIALFIGPIEEFGWRGLALPLLQRAMAPFWAGLLLGFVWAAWHIPAFFIGGAPQSSWSFPAFFIGVMALSVILTPMFNAARGSLLIPVLFHFQANGPAWPDAQPWDTPLFVAVAAVVVWFNRQTLFRRQGAAVDVVRGAS